MNIPSTSMQCPVHGLPLTLSSEDSEEATLVCEEGCTYPKVRGIFRFVDQDNYANSFGLQWNVYRRTQLDSFTKTSTSRDRLLRCLGGSWETIRGKDVLEAGCGAGRFTEVLLKEGARLFAADLSSAVDAAYENIGDYPDYFVCQADISKLPLAPGEFDVVVCLGVVQHTPDPEQTMHVLCSHVKPGGMVVLDHYTRDAHAGRAQRLFRAIMLRMSPRAAHFFCRVLVAILWPFHRVAYTHQGKRGAWRLQKVLEAISPLQDYQRLFPDMDAKSLREWTLLDTHDALTDRYKHGRTTEEIAECLRESGMTDVAVSYAGNGVEARARKPIR